VIDEVLCKQLLRLHTLQESIFLKSQSVQDLNEKMRCLFKNMRAINKLDHWTKLHKAFQESMTSDPWYPVPLLENPHTILKEIINESVPDGVLQFTVEASDACLGKGLTIKLSFKGTKDSTTIAIKGRKEAPVNVSLP
jgi:hypothetical protein